MVRSGWLPTMWSMYKTPPGGNWARRLSCGKMCNFDSQTLALEVFISHATFCLGFW